MRELAAECNSAVAVVAKYKSAAAGAALWWCHAVRSAVLQGVLHASALQHRSANRIARMLLRSSRFCVPPYHAAAIASRSGTCSR
jgi:hypothetical protein